MTLRIALFTAVLLAAPGLFAQRVPGRYIVELTGTSVSEAVPGLLKRSRAQAAAGHRKRIRDAQQQVRGRLELEQAKVLDCI